MICTLQLYQQRGLLTPPPFVPPPPPPTPSVSSTASHDAPDCGVAGGAEEGDEAPGSAPEPPRERPVPKLALGLLASRGQSDSHSE